MTNGSTYPSSCTDSSGVNNANITSYEIFGTSAYFNDYVYLGVTPTSSTAPGGVRQFEYSGHSRPSPTPHPPSSRYPRHQSLHLRQRDDDGIVWMIDEGFPLQNTQNIPATPAPPNRPQCHSPCLFRSQLPQRTLGQQPEFRRHRRLRIKFTSPVVANGKVYISTRHDLTTVTNPQGEIDVYGLK